MFALHNTTSSGAGHNFQQFCTVSRACHTPTNLQMCRGDRPLGTSSSNSVPQVWMFSSSSTWHSSHTWHSSPWHSSYTWHSTTWPSSYTWHSSPGHSSYTWHSNPWHSSHTWHTNTWHSSCTCSQAAHGTQAHGTLHLMSAFSVALRSPSVFGLRSSVTLVSSSSMALKMHMHSDYTCTQATAYLFR